MEQGRVEPTGKVGKGGGVRQWDVLQACPVATWGDLGRSFCLGPPNTAVASGTATRKEHIEMGVKG